MTSAGRSHRKWVELKARAKVEMPWVCHLCGRPIDPALDPNDRWAWTLDHVLAKETHPHLVHSWSNVRPAHRTCNSSKGKRGIPQKPEPRRSSRVW